ncbi:MAG: hypothetical protein C5B59_12295 [Bacteroidetes bacterium]|nr:MAG: hypothetical protein C5B59_12295 [Bacteroidota bacterium]
MDARDQQIRNWSMLCHLSALVGLLIPWIPLGNIIGPLIVWQAKKTEFPEINVHGKESLNFQITISLITIILGMFLMGSFGYSAFIGNSFAMFTSGIGAALLLGLIRLTSLILVVVASVRANSGELFKYPSIRFIK